VRSSPASEDRVRAADDDGVVVKTTRGVVERVDEGALGTVKVRDAGEAVYVHKVRRAGGGFLNPRFALVGADGRVIGVVVRNRVWSCFGAEWEYLRPLAHARVGRDGVVEQPASDALMRALEFAAK
jgi:hypothetical protein